LYGEKVLFFGDFGIDDTIAIITWENNIRMGVQYILLKLRWFKSQEGTFGCLFLRQYINIFFLQLIRNFTFCNDI